MSKEKEVGCKLCRESDQSDTLSGLGFGFEAYIEDDKLIMTHVTDHGQTESYAKIQYCPRCGTKL